MARFASCKRQPYECARALAEDRLECDTLEEAGCPAGRTIGADCGLRFDDEPAPAGKAAGAGRRQSRKVAAGGLAGWARGVSEAFSGSGLAANPAVVRVGIVVLVVGVAALALTYFYPSNQPVAGLGAPGEGSAPAPSGTAAPAGRRGSCDAASLTSATQAEAADALSTARACQAAGRLDDAVRTYSELKERGSGEAALALGAMFDPLDPSQKQQPRLKPSIINAVELYRQACALHAHGAAERLEYLRAKAEEEATDLNDRMLLDLVAHWPACP